MGSLGNRSNLVDYQQFSESMDAQVTCNGNCGCIHDPLARLSVRMECISSTSKVNDPASTVLLPAVATCVIWYLIPIECDMWRVERCVMASYSCPIAPAFSCPCRNLWNLPHMNSVAMWALLPSTNRPPLRCLHQHSLISTCFAIPAHSTPFCPCRLLGILYIRCSSHRFL